MPTFHSLHFEDEVRQRGGRKHVIRHGNEARLGDGYSTEVVAKERGQPLGLGESSRQLDNHDLRVVRLRGGVERPAIGIEQVIDTVADIGRLKPRLRRLGVLVHREVGTFNHEDRVLHRISVATHL